VVLSTVRINHKCRTAVEDQTIPFKLSVRNGYHKPGKFHKLDHITSHQPICLHFPVYLTWNTAAGADPYASTPRTDLASLSTSTLRNLPPIVNILRRQARRGRSATASRDSTPPKTTMRMPELMREKIPIMLENDLVPVTGLSQIQVLPPRPIENHYEVEILRILPRPSTKLPLINAPQSSLRVA
jgi:hypothetical protein